MEGAESVTVGSGLTTIGFVAVLEHPFSTTSYVISTEPSLAGVNSVPLTCVPENVPVEGLTYCVKSTGVSSRQISSISLNVIEGFAYTVTEEVTVFSHEPSE